MKTESYNQYIPNWLDRNHLGFVNLILSALRPHARDEGNELLFSQRLEADEMNAHWPRPWLYLRTLVLFIVGFGMLYFSWKYEGRVESSNLLPGLSVLGSLAMPVTLLVFFWETNKWRSLTLLDVLRYFLLGSCLAIGITFALNFVLDLLPDERLYYNGYNYFTPRRMLDYGLMPFSITALVEEFAKAVIIFSILFRHGGRCHILHGILVGAAVGAGFAVFESAGYIAMDTDHLLRIFLLRSLTALTCHVVWGALLGGGMALATKGHVRFVSLFNPKLILIFLLVCVLHFTWNVLQDSVFPFNLSVELGIVTWFLLLLLMWRGLREIAREKVN